MRACFEGLRRSKNRKYESEKEAACFNAVNRQLTEIIKNSCETIEKLFFSRLIKTWKIKFPLLKRDFENFRNTICLSRFYKYKFIH